MKYFILALMLSILSIGINAQQAPVAVIADVNFNRDNVKMENGKCVVGTIKSVYKDSPCELLYPKADAAGSTLTNQAETNEVSAVQ